MEPCFTFFTASPILMLLGTRRDDTALHVLATAKPRFNGRFLLASREHTMLTHTLPVAIG
jgi:hypothetical protein